MNRFTNISNSDLAFIIDEWVKGEQPVYSYSGSPVDEKVDYYSDTDFGQAIRNKDINSVMALFDELMTVLQAVYPRLYNGVMSKL